jgi:hypothetical protein
VGGDGDEGQTPAHAASRARGVSRPLVATGWVSR